MIRLRVFSPLAQAELVMPDGDKLFCGIPVNMLNKGRIYVGGAKRYPDAHEVEPATPYIKPDKK